MPKKYIDAEATAQEIEQLPFTMSMALSADECEGMRRAQYIIAQYIRNTIPAVEDAVVVTRCKYCDYFKYSLCDRWADGTLMCPDDYCSRALRAEEEI